MATLEFRAKQGDTQAIAALLKTAFPVQPIEVTARLEHSCLILHLETLDLLEQAPTLTFLEKWLLLLHPSGIDFVQVQAQLQGQANLSWEKSLPLGQLAPYNKEPTHGSTPGENDLLTVDELGPYYQQLNLEPGTTIEVINQTYLKLKVEAQQQDNSERLTALKETYQTLKTQLQLRANLAAQEERELMTPTAQLGHLLQQQGLRTTQISFAARQLHIQLPISHYPKPRKPVAKIYTLLETLNLANLQLDDLETVVVYGLSAPKQVVWQRQFPLPKQGFSREDTDLLSFRNRFSSAIIFPALSILAWVLNIMPLTKFLLRGVKIWFHEFGHATIAWLSGRRAIPLPFGWTNVEPNRSLFVYFAILLLLLLLFWVGRREKRRWPMILAVAIALLQFWMTWLMPLRTFNVLLAFGGIGGEFYLCAFFMVSYFFSLPEYFRWDFYRFPVVLGAAFTLCWVSLRSTQPTPFASLRLCARYQNLNSYSIIPRSSPDKSVEPRNKIESLIR